MDFLFIVTLFEIMMTILDFCKAVTIHDLQKYHAYNVIISFFSREGTSTKDLSNTFFTKFALEFDVTLIL